MPAVKVSRTAKRVRGKASGRGAKRARIRCRVCLRQVGSIPEFEGLVFVLCEGCEEAIRAGRQGRVRVELI